MDGVYYLVFIVAIATIIHWYVINDANKPGGLTKGLLAMVQLEDRRKKKNNRPR